MVIDSLFFRSNEIRKVDDSWVKAVNPLKKKKNQDNEIWQSHMRYHTIALCINKLSRKIRFLCVIESLSLSHREEPWNVTQSIHCFEQVKCFFYLALFVLYLFLFFSPLRKSSSRKKSQRKKKKNVNKWITEVIKPKIDR